MKLARGNPVSVWSWQAFELAPRFAVGVRVLALLILTVPPLASAAAESNQVQRLQEELDRAKTEIERLREENARLRGEVPPPPSSTPASLAPARTTVPSTPVPSPAPYPAGVRQPVAPAVQLPAPVENELVPIEQLVNDYRTSTLGADARYRGATFRLQGAVQSFRKVFAGMNWHVQLQGDDPLGVARCTVTFPGISDFQVSSDEKSLLGRRPFKPWHSLIAVGERCVVQGTCEGLKESSIVMRDCRLVSD